MIALQVLVGTAIALGAAVVIKLTWDFTRAVFASWRFMKFLDNGWK